ncbi:MAG TPA: hypothetical protein PLP86_02875 [Armatimonadota bacterium]|nr:hypothetical protein [Armatimonadota bacterium]
MRIWLVLILLTLPCVSWCESRQQITLEDQNQEPIIIEANTIELIETPPVVRAQGDVLFRQGQKLLLAEEFVYDYNNETGVLQNATFTTCDREDMDYRVTASKIRLTSDQRLKARRVRIYLGKLRVISLPSLAINVGPRTERNTLLPIPGYNNRDGFFLANSYSLVGTQNTDVDLRLKLTTGSGIQGGVTAGFALQGDSQLVPPYVPDYGSELNKDDVLRPRVIGDECVFPESRHSPSILSVFGAVLVRERAFDIDEPDIQVTRLPEIGLRYVSPQVCVLDDFEFPSVGVQSEVRASWGRFKQDNPDTRYISRFDVRGHASTTLAAFGDNTALRATGLARYSYYDSEESYKVLAGALDATRIYPGGSFASLRLILHETSGSTPFEFDDIDIRKELQTAGRYVRGRNTYEILLKYDLDEGSLRDWEFSVARRLHCLEPSITWRNRFSQISIGLRVLGF